MFDIEWAYGDGLLTIQHDSSVHRVLVEGDQAERLMQLLDACREAADGAEDLLLLGVWLGASMRHAHKCVVTQDLPSFLLRRFVRNNQPGGDHAG